MQVVLGSNVGANHASASSGSRCIRTSPTDWNYVVGRMGRKIQNGTEVNLRQQKESRECRGQDPSDGTVFSVDFPWGTMKGVSDEYHNWLLIEDESGCRVVPAPFVHLKSSNPEVPYDINQVEKEMEKRREKRNQEDRRARKSRRLEDQLVGKRLKPFELPDIASDDNNSDCEAAGAVKNIRREEEGWDARKEEVNEFADDDASVVEWSDNEEEAPVKPAKSPEEEESDEDSNGKEFKTADDEKDLLDACGRELDRMLDDLDLPKSTDHDDRRKLVVSAAEKRAIKYAEKYIAPATPETCSTEAPSEISKPESTSSDGSIPNRSPAMRQFPVVRTTQKKLPSLFSKDPKTAIILPSNNATKLCWSAKTPSQTSKAKAVPSVPLPSIGRCPSASSRTREDLKTSSGVKFMELPAVTGCVRNDERRKCLEKPNSTPPSEKPPTRIMSTRKKSVVNERDESMKQAVVVERRRKSTAVSPPEIPLPRRRATEEEEMLPRERTKAMEEAPVERVKSTCSNGHRSSPKSETTPVNSSPPSETPPVGRVKSTSSRSELSAPRDGHRSSPVTQKSSPVRRKDTVSVEPTKRRCDDEVDYETDRATVLSRINSALDRPGGATLESVLATFDITHKHSALYEIVVSELKIVAKLKHSGYLVRRKKRTM